MSDDKYQQIRIRVTKLKEIIRINAETDKDYKRVKGIHVAMSQDYHHTGTCLGLKIGQKELFTDLHETKLLTCGMQVAPNQKFFLFEEFVEGNGSVVEGKFTDGGYVYPPYEVILYLWLTNKD